MITSKIRKYDEIWAQVYHFEANQSIDIRRKCKWYYSFFSFFLFVCTTIPWFKFVRIKGTTANIPSKNLLNEFGGASHKDFHIMMLKKSIYQTNWINVWRLILTTFEITGEEDLDCSNTRVAYFVSLFCIPTKDKTLQQFYIRNKYNTHDMF